jgi:hypothetical protein
VGQHRAPQEPRNHAGGSGWAGVDTTVSPDLDAEVERLAEILRDEFEDDEPQAPSLGDLLGDEEDWET